MTIQPVTRTQRLAGRVCLITGAGQGLGRVFAWRLAAEGATVALADLNAGAAERVAKEIEKRFGTDTISLAVDVSAEDQVTAAVDESVRQLGSVDVLINNASVFSTLTMKDAVDITTAEWDRVMAVNLRGAFLCCRAVIPVMRSAGRGKIINISSSTVFLGRPQYCHYVASKAAVTGLTRALATEVGPYGITVNAVAPGSTETEIRRDTVTPDQARAIIAAQALKRRETAADLEGTIAFLASTDSDFITGQTIVVDGGASYH